MPSQYALRFESGERRGELVPIVGASGQGRAFTIGRKPGNSLQVSDPSVSGRHAEIVVDEAAGTVLVRDLTSTNGTHVGGRRVTEATLGEGDEFLLGAVPFTIVDRARPAASGDDELTLEDGDFGDDLDSPDDALPALGETRIQPRESALEISSADLARSAKTSKLAPLALVGLAALAALAFVWSRSGDDGGDGPARASARVPAPAGSLLAGAFSFESGAEDGWAPEGGGPAEFRATSAAALSGRRGLRAELQAGDVARLASDSVQAGGPVALTGAFRTEGRDVVGRLGLEYGFAGGRSVVVWSNPVRGAEFADVTLDGTPPASATSLRVLIEAVSLAEPSAVASASATDGDEGEFATVDVDDVALVRSDASRETLFSHGSFAAVATAARDGRPSSLALDWRGDVYAPLLTVQSDGLGTAPLTVRSAGDELLLTPAADGTLELHVIEDLATARIATTAEGADVADGEHPGYAAHGPEFESPTGARGLLVGGDASLVHVVFPDARTIAGRAGGGLVRFAAPVRAGETIALRFDFTEERTLAERLARRARTETKDGRPGAAYATWSELLRVAPFSADLVQAASAGQNQIVNEGRRELKELEEDVERARFFRLGDLYREKLALARALGQRYAGSGVDSLVGDLVVRIEAELVELEGGRAGYELGRLGAIRAALERAGAENLAREVARYRDQLAPTKDNER